MAPEVWAVLHSIQQQAEERCVQGRTQAVLKNQGKPTVQGFGRKSMLLFN